MFWSKKKHILLVDDDESLLKSLEIYFGKQDYKVSSISEGTEALASLSGTKLPDLVILDVMMDGVNGLSVLTALKKNVYGKAVPVIVTSAFQNPDMVRRSYELGAALFMPKPFKVERLAFEAKRLLH
ncbi:MAG: response regulator [Deltaproteobacteria bacterium]|nr:response regulator [Deltaproteobacteria bacterium]